MKYPRLIAAGFAAAASLFTVAACADVEPTAPSAVDVSTPDLKRSHPTKAAERAALLTDVPVSGVLSDGGTFAGTFTARRLSIDEATRQLSMTGILSGVATLADGSTENVTQLFTTTLDMTSSRNMSSNDVKMHNVSQVPGCEVTAGTSMFQQASYVRQVQASCDVLFLDLGPISLDLLGLTVDLSQVILDVNAVTGPGNLLGNLLCGLLGLLDGVALIGAITTFLDNINAILEGISGIIGASDIVSPAAASASYTIS